MDRKRKIKVLAQQGKFAHEDARHVRTARWLGKAPAGGGVSVDDDDDDDAAEAEADSNTEKSCFSNHKQAASVASAASGLDV